MALHCCPRKYAINFCLRSPRGNANTRGDFAGVIRKWRGIPRALCRFPPLFLFSILSSRTSVGSPRAGFSWPVYATDSVSCISAPPIHSHIVDAHETPSTQPHHWRSPEDSKISIPFVAFELSMNKLHGNCHFPSFFASVGLYFATVNVSRRFRLMYLLLSVIIVKFNYKPWLIDSTNTRKFQ